MRTAMWLLLLATTAPAGLRAQLTPGVLPPPVRAAPRADVALDSIRQLSRQLAHPDADSARLHAELRQRLVLYVSQSAQDDKALGEAYGLLLPELARDPTAQAADLLPALDAYLRYARPDARDLRLALLALAEHPAGRARAERLARELPRRHRQDLGHAHFDGADSARADFQRRWLEHGQAMMHDVLGWSALQAGRLEAAQAELAQALFSVPDPLGRYHAGVLAERLGKLDEAAQAYAEGYLQEDPTVGGPNHAALRRLAAQPGRPADWLEQVVAPARERARSRARELELRQRIADPQAMPAFDLDLLDGGKLSSRELEGRIAVVNFWGAWCAPCVQEIPYLQALQARYRGDPEVVIVTVNSDPDPQQAREFVRTHDLTFPVLVADAAIKRAISGWPTTWFVDRAGRIEYISRGFRAGTDEEQLDRMVWRVESLR